MALTRRQKWRIEKVQSEKIARANKASSKTENNRLPNEKEQQGLVITRYGQRQLVKSLSGELFQCTGRKNIGLSVAGDKVLFQPAGGNEGIVTAIYPRKNELKRQDRLIAANIDQLWLVVSIEPHYEFELIDRYLILAENSKLPINIVKKGTTYKDIMKILFKIIFQLPKREMLFFLKYSSTDCLKSVINSLE